MNVKILGQIFLASAAIGAGYEIGRALPFVTRRVLSKKFREDVKTEIKKREQKLTVVS